MFESIAAAPPDPILGLGEAFQKDPRSGKINLSIGVYQDDQGRTCILDTVKKAEARLLASESTRATWASMASRTLHAWHANWSWAM